MPSRSPALPYAAVVVLAFLFGVADAVRRYLPLWLSNHGLTPPELSAVLLGMSVVNALFVPVGAVAVGYAFADGLDVATRLGVTVAATFLLAAVGYLVGFGVVLGLLPANATGTASLLRNLLVAVVVGFTNGLAVVVAVVAGAAVRRLRRRPPAPGSAG